MYLNLKKLKEAGKKATKIKQTFEN